MKATRYKNNPSNKENAILISTEELMRITGLGKMCATELGMKAGAEVRLGRMRRWSIAKVNEYLSR